MALKRRYIVVCDICLTEFGTGTTPRGVREKAAREGWTRVKSSGVGRKDGEDRCPRHAVKATEEGQ